MVEDDLMKDINAIDELLGRCVNPALTRNEHDSVRQAMKVIKERVKLSFKLEKEMKEVTEANKEVQD